MVMDRREACDRAAQVRTDRRTCRQRVNPQCHGIACARALKAQLRLWLGTRRARAITDLIDRLPPFWEIAPSLVRSRLGMAVSYLGKGPQNFDWIVNQKAIGKSGDQKTAVS